MNSSLDHHVIAFPEGRLHFDLPANLRRSPDFLNQRLASEVAYDRIPWLIPSASDVFVSIQWDLPQQPDSQSLATVSVEMWLCAAPTGFDGDVTTTEDLRRANGELDRADGKEPKPLIETAIHDRVWLYRGVAGAFLLGLNRNIYLCARVSLVGGRDDPGAQEQAATLRDLIIGSLRFEQNELAALTPKADLP